MLAHDFSIDNPISDLTEDARSAVQDIVRATEAGLSLDTALTTFSALMSAYLIQLLPAELQLEDEPADVRASYSSWLADSLTPETILNASRLQRKLSPVDDF